MYHPNIHTGDLFQEMILRNPQWEFRKVRKFDKKYLFLFAKLMQISTIFLEGLEAKLLSTWCYTRIHQLFLKGSKTV